MRSCLATVARNWPLTLFLIGSSLVCPSSTAVAALVTERHEVRPFYAQTASIDVTGDGESDLTFRAHDFICTADIPISACVASIDVRGTSDVEFLLLPSDTPTVPVPLSNGTFLGPAVPGGLWAAADPNRVSLTYRTSQRYGTSSYDPEPLPNDDFYRIGFRVRAGGSYHYGWLDLRLYSHRPPFGNRPGGRVTNLELVSSTYEGTLGQGVRVQTVPEPATLLLVMVAAVSCGAWYSQRKLLRC